MDRRLQFNRGQLQPLELKQMWTEVENKTRTLLSDVNSSEMAVPMHTWKVFNTVQQQNGSTAAATRPSSTEDPFARGNGIIPGAIAAAVFIGFLLVLYGVLWKCMVSPPQRKKRKVRVRRQPRIPV